MKNLTTDELIKWHEQQPEDIKLRYRLNHNIPHSLFNISCKYFDSSQLQEVNFHEFFKYLSHKYQSINMKNPS